MSHRGEVLVAIINNQRDLDLAREQHWYRIPVERVAPWLKKGWPPQWLAFYQTKVFESAAYTVTYYAPVQRIQIVDRVQLFPEEAPNDKSQKRYYKVEIGALQELPQPIVSFRRRRITFIQTTFFQLTTALTVEDLYDDRVLAKRRLNPPA